ncbi:MAG: hypothetical protein ACRELX_12785 [Longimicrobiales bacterium]
MRQDPDCARALEQLAEFSTLAKTLPFEMDRWRVQNEFYAMVNDVYPQFADRARGGDDGARRWVQLFTGVGEQLSVAVP